MIAPTARAGLVRDDVIDHIKAAAILAVIAQHALAPYGMSSLGAIGRVLEPALHFHVPAFLFASGFLARTHGQLTGREVARRLWRILPPYVIACVVIELAGLPGRNDTPSFVLALLTGNVVTIHYFVFVLVTSILLMWPLSRMSDRALGLVFAGLVVYQAAFPTIGPSIWGPIRVVFWGMRDPGIYYPYFLAGWLARPHARSIEAWLRARAGAVLVVAISVGLAYCAGWWLSAAVAKDLWCTTRLVYVTCVLAVVAVISPEGRPPAWVRTLSENTYPIYLYHYPFVVAVFLLLEDSPGAVRAILGAIVALTCTLLGVTLLRLMLGRSSRVLVGA